MKVRSGFVSNSSSSNFLILREGKGLTDEDKHQKNLKYFEGPGFGNYDEEDKQSFIDKLEGKVYIGSMSIPYGDGDEHKDVEEAIATVLEEFGIDEEISLEDEEYL